MPNIFGTVIGGAILAGGDEKPPVLKPHAVLPNLGNPTPSHLKYAEQLRDSLPDSVRAAAREPVDAMALVYAMLLSDDQNQRAQQLAGLEQQAGGAVREKTAALYPDVSQAASHAHLPMLNLSLGALKQLSPEQYDVFSTRVALTRWEKLRILAKGFLHRIHRINVGKASMFVSA